MDANKPIYYGIFLDQANRNKLLEWWKNIVGIPFLDQIFAHHMTVKFKPSKEDIDIYNSLIGQTVELKIVGYGVDDKGQAVLVIPDKLDSSNANPHITVSCAIGVTPVYSNQLLEAGSKNIDGPALTGIFDSFPRTL